MKIYHHDYTCLLLCIICLASNCFFPCFLFVTSCHRDPTTLARSYQSKQEASSIDY
ncbi:hypothetical protein BDB00DRAFT_804006 [Zychaea mexicana]|uniref:uncharacterized protein n=1 Tax=Zychaea mexicana TaxID=64656 RepID=UPI0022FDE035|nr:uncharacterized protein BDB00DRAFT_804006 [Zychaea mexicana]KAI9497777.1 hypothetical protein BDB00DRAFT_804006 [Zychaea mexicana]